MSVRSAVVVSVVAVVGASACASTPVRVEEVKAPREAHFVKRPAKPRDCAFEVFEAPREPGRPYEVLGTLPVDTNMWLGAKGRKTLLRDTTCRAGADAVLLSRPSERMMGNTQMREYVAVFIAYTDGAGARASDAAESPVPPVESEKGDILFVPVGEDLLGDTEGSMKRPLGPEDDAYWE